MLNDLLDGFACLHALPQDGIGYVGALRDLRQRQAFALESHEHIAAGVVVLRIPRRPSAIRRFVVTAWVNTIDRVIRWARTHVRQECQVVIAPAVTHRDAATAVELVVRGALGVTAALHAAPNRVLALLHASDYPAVLDMPARAHRPLLTAARRRMSAQQVLTVLDRFGATRAATEPMRAIRSGWIGRSLKDGQFTEDAAGQVGHGRLGHGHYYTVASTAYHEKVIRLSLEAEPRVSGASPTTATSDSTE